MRAKAAPGGAPVRRRRPAATGRRGTRPGAVACGTRRHDPPGWLSAFTLPVGYLFADGGVRCIRRHDRHVASASDAIDSEKGRKRHTPGLVVLRRLSGGGRHLSRSGGFRREYAKQCVPRLSVSALEITHAVRPGDTHGSPVSIMHRVEHRKLPHPSGRETVRLGVSSAR